MSWEMFGYPDFMLQDADQLMDAQYADHPRLRSIADAVLAWASAQPGVHIQLRKGFGSLHSTRRKFAQLTRSTSKAVDVTLRIEANLDGRLESVKTRPDDPFTHRVRLTSAEQVDDQTTDDTSKSAGTKYLAHLPRSVGRAPPGGIDTTRCMPERDVNKRKRT